ncbi:regulator of G protein signaling superfamily [Wallemia mellicola]|nr:regulator of G protein signaling superfamily [Wallemia mellicola]
MDAGDKDQPRVKFDSKKMSQSSQVMKTSRRGRPYVRDLHDLFSTMVVSLDLKTHRNIFKSYSNSFTTDEACSNLHNLKFSQSVRLPDPNNPSKIITTTSTTTFSMERQMAKGVCQIFMDAHLIINASDTSSRAFKDRGIYLITPKGLHVLERFISKNGISAEHLINVFSTQTICLKLLHLERRPIDDEILVNKQIINIVFRRFVGRQPNYSPESQPSKQSMDKDSDKGNGVPVNDIYMTKAAVSSEVADIHHTFASNAALDWLLDYTTIAGRDEAAEIAAHFVRYGLIRLVSEKGKRGDDLIVTVNYAQHPDDTVLECQFRAGSKCEYGITPAGRRAALWETGSTNESSDSLDRSSSSKHRDSHNLARQQSKAGGQLQAQYAHERTRDAAVAVASAHHKESNTGRLKQILDDPALRSLFREFLRSNFCEENLSFWLDVQDFKRKFSTTSSAVAKPQHFGLFSKSSDKKGGPSAMQQHQQDINAMACVIYNTYLAPSSSSELNIDHGLRAELVNYVATIKREAREKYGTEIKPDTNEDNGLGQIPLQASQISRLIVLYERIQAYIFRLMATDSVPKFVKTERFLNLMKTFEEYQETLIHDKSTPPVPPLPKENEGSNSSLRSHSVHSLRSSKKSHNSTEALANTTSNTSLGSKQSSREDS